MNHGYHHLARMARAEFWLAMGFLLAALIMPLIWRLG